MVGGPQEHRGAGAAQERLRSGLLRLPATPSGLRSSGRAAVRVHSSLGLPGLLSVPHAAGELPALWGPGGRSPLGQREASTNQCLYAVSRALGTEAVLERGGGIVSDFLGEGMRFGGIRRAVGAEASNAGTDLRPGSGRTSICQGTKISDLGVSDRRSHPAALGGQRADGEDLRELLRHDWPRAVLPDRVCLLGHVETILAGDSREMLPGAPYLGPLPHCGQNEWSPGRRASRRGAETVRRRT